VVRRVLAALVLFGVLPLGVLALSFRAADLFGGVLGRMAAVVGAFVRAQGVRDAARSPLPPAPIEPPTPAPTASAQEAPPLGKRVAKSSKKQRRGDADARAHERVVFLSESTVLALAERGVLPSATPVPADGVRPAGLRLSGVNALGVGMRDGDVITSVLGAPATSVETVVQRVLAARARQVRVISAEFWRGAERFRLAVEQPYIGDVRSGRGGAPAERGAAP